MGHQVKCPKCGKVFWVHRGQNIAWCRKKYGGCGNRFNAHTNLKMELEHG